MASVANRRNRLAVPRAPSPGQPGAPRCAVCRAWTGHWASGHGGGRVYCERHAVSVDQARWRLLSGVATLVASAGSGVP